MINLDFAANDKSLSFDEWTQSRLIQIAVILKWHNHRRRGKVKPCQNRFSKRICFCGPRKKVNLGKQEEKVHLQTTTIDLLQLKGCSLS